MKKIFKSTKAVISALLIVMLLISLMPTYSSAKAKVKLNKTKATLYVGKSVTLKLKNNKKKIKWSTSNKKVATVSKKGKVKAKKKGKATITAKVGKKKYKCKITVKVKNTPKKITKTPTVLKNTPKPTMKPTTSNGEAQLRLSNDGKTVLGVYNPDSATVINIPSTVTTLGKDSLYYCIYVKTLEIPSSVTTIEIGALPSKLTSIYIPPSVTLIGDQNIPTTCIIYGETGTSAEARANEFSCTFIATNPTPAPTPKPNVESISFKEDEITIQHGESLIVSLSVYPSDNATIDDGGGRRINWESSNPDLIEKISDVSMHHLSARITIRDGMTGTATITATLSGMDISATCKVTVPDVEAELELSEDGTTVLGVTNADRATVINIPSTVTTLGERSLLECDYVKTIEIPSSITTIENIALPQALTSLNIPSSVTSMGYQSVNYACIIYGEAGSYAEQWTKKEGHYTFIAK